MRLLIAVAAAGGLSHLVLIAAGWGYVASWVNQLLKQDGFPTLINTIIADLVLLVTAAMVTLQQQSGTFTWHGFAQALFAAAAAALVNHQFVLSPTGIGEAIKSATSIVKALPSTVPYTEPPIVLPPSPVQPVMPAGKPVTTARRAGPPAKKAAKRRG